jgi:hypothetical protein
MEWESLGYGVAHKAPGPGSPKGHAMKNDHNGDLLSSLLATFFREISGARKLKMNLVFDGVMKASKVE